MPPSGWCGPAGLDPARVETIDWLQGRLVGLMGELGVFPEDAERYREAGYPSIEAGDVETIEREALAIEESGISFDGWARPGASGDLAGANLDVARTVCRRAERRVRDLGDGVTNPGITRFLNRASDLLWLLARSCEQE